MKLAGLRRKRSGKGERGFSLIEVMVAVAILTIGLLAVGTGEIQSLTIYKRNVEILKAVSVAGDIIEMMRRNNEDLSDYAGFNTSDATSTPVTMAEDDFNQWKASVEAITSEELLSDEEALVCGEMTFRQGACGTVTIVPGILEDTSTVTVTIVWPGRPTGITIITTI